MKIDFIKTILEPFSCFQNVKCELRDITKTGVQKSSSEVRHTHRRTFVADTQDRTSFRLINCRLHKILSVDIVDKNLRCWQNVNKRNLYFSYGAGVRRVCGCVKKVHVLLSGADVTKKCRLYCLVRVWQKRCGFDCLVRVSEKVRVWCGCGCRMGAGVDFFAPRGLIIC